MIKKEKYYPKGIDKVIRTGSQWNGTCPLCYKQDKFYMNMYTGLWDCKSCSETGNYFQFLKKTGQKEDIKRKKTKIKKVKFKLENESKNEKLNVQSLFQHKTVEPEDKENIPKAISLPDHFIKIKKASKYVHVYIKSRRYKLREFDKVLHTYFCGEGKWWNRIIFPVIMKGKVRGYLGRWIEDKEHPPVKRKYRNSSGTDFSLMLANYDNLVPKDMVIVTEGILSGFRIGYNWTCTFGKKISSFQMKLLKKKDVKKVLLLFDANAKKEIVKLAARMYENKFEVYILLLKDGDPDDLDNNDGKLYIKVVKESEKYFPTKIVGFDLKTDKELNIRRYKNEDKKSKRVVRCKLQQEQKMVES